MSKDDRDIVISKRMLIIILLLLLLLLLLAIALGFGFNKWIGNDDGPTNDNGKNPDIDPGAGDWNGGQPSDGGGASTGIKIPGYSYITIPKETANVNVVLLNPEGNPCYFKFEIVLDDTDETLYESKLVPPGQAITNITLSKAFAAGEYAITIKVSTFSLEDLSPMNGANVKTVFIAQ